METKNYEYNARKLAALLRYGMFPSPMDPTLFALGTDEDWREIFSIASRQAVAPLAFAGMMSLPDVLRPAQSITSEWKSAATRASFTGEWMMKLLEKLLKTLSDGGVDAVVIKGGDLSALYPRPELRPLGGLELLVGAGDFDRAVSLLADDGCTLEQPAENGRAELRRNNIRIGVNINAGIRRSGRAGEIINDYLSGAARAPVPLRMHGVDFPVMEDGRRCVALLAHIGDRLCDGGADLRCLCDWAMFVHSVPSPETWQRWFSGILSRAGLARLAIYLTACAGKYLELSYPWSVSVSEEGVERLFDELTAPSRDEEDDGLFTTGISGDDDAAAPAEKGKIAGIFGKLTGKKAPAAEVSGPRQGKRRRREIVSELRLFETE